MPVIQLVVVVCLYQSPDVCETKVFPLYEPTSTLGCMMQAQPYLAEWAGTHPDWSVKAWKCGLPGSGTREA